MSFLNFLSGNLVEREDGIRPTREEASAEIAVLRLRLAETAKSSGRVMPAKEVLPGAAQAHVESAWRSLGYALEALGG